MNKNFIETSENCFNKIEKFSYKANYMKDNLGLPNDYKGFKISSETLVLDFKLSEYTRYHLFNVF